MTEKPSVRIDKYLWAVRLYKTRSQAAEACRKGRILIEGVPLRPSKLLHGSEVITVKKPPVTYTYRILNIIENRIPAKMAGLNIEDLTPESEKSRLDIHQSVFPGYRKKGSGRPTKKERRIIDRWNDTREW